MNMSYETAIIPTSERLIELYDNAGLPRPTNDKERTKKYTKIQTLLVHSGTMIYRWNCYLADLAIRNDY